MLDLNKMSAVILENGSGKLNFDSDFYQHKKIRNVPHLIFFCISCKFRFTNYCGLVIWDTLIETFIFIDTDKRAFQERFDIGYLILT